MTVGKRANKAGSSKGGAAHRRKLFVDAYLSNGRNATQAAIAAGFSQKTARAQGCKLLTHADVVKLVGAATAKIEAISGLTVERTLQELARLAYHDSRKVYNSDGSLKALHELDDDTAAAIAGVEVNEVTAEGVVIGQTKKLKFWDKNAALEKAMKHLGLFERDNRQQQPVKVEIELLG